jgi:flagellin
MSLYINTNTDAMGTLRNLQNTSNALSTSIQRLSSGLRINSAKDDPAGLIISENLKSQINGMNQAITNAQNANNVIQTADGGLSEVTSLLQSINQLAVAAANTGANDPTAVQADQTQISSAIQSIDRIVSDTQYGSKKLLDGTSGVTSVVTNTTDLGGISIGGTFAGQATVAGNVTVQVTTAASFATSAGAATYASTTSLISQVNGGTTGTGGTIVINGQSIQVSSSDTVQTMIDKINNISSTTGVSAQFVSGASGGHIELDQTNYGSNFNINYSESSTILGAQTFVSGANAVAAVTVGGVTATFTGGQSTGASGLQLTDSSGNSILLTEAGNTNLSTAAVVGTVSQGSLTFQIGANAGQNVSISIGNMASTQLGNTVVAGQSLNTIDVTTAQGAQNAIQIVQQALSQVSVLRAQLGSFQDNTLNSTINALGITSENLTASQASIADANVAQEVVNMTQNSILQQAGMSVLAQANQEPQMVLKLLG